LRLFGAGVYAFIIYVKPPGSRFIATVQEKKKFSTP
jgi:hypothetical protein